MFNRPTSMGDIYTILLWDGWIKITRITRNRVELSYLKNITRSAHWILTNVGVLESCCLMEQHAIVGQTRKNHILDIYMVKVGAFDKKLPWIY